MGETIEDEINFYCVYAEPLILTLDNLEDRQNATSWLKLLKASEFGAVRERLVYLKMLYYSLKKGTLIRPFNVTPTGDTKALKLSEELLQNKISVFRMMVCFNNLHKKHCSMQNIQDDYMFMNATFAGARVESYDTEPTQAYFIVDHEYENTSKQSNQLTLSAEEPFDLEENEQLISVTEELTDITPHVSTVKQSERHIVLKEDNTPETSHTKHQRSSHHKAQNRHKRSFPTTKIERAIHGKLQSAAHLIKKEKHKMTYVVQGALLTPKTHHSRSKQKENVKDSTKNIDQGQKPDVISEMRSLTNVEAIQSISGPRAQSYQLYSKPVESIRLREGITKHQMNLPVQTDDVNPTLLPEIKSLKLETLERISESPTQNYMYTRPVASPRRYDGIPVNQMNFSGQPGFQQTYPRPSFPINDIRPVFKGLTNYVTATAEQSKDNIGFMNNRHTTVDASTDPIQTLYPRDLTNIYKHHTHLLAAPADTVQESGFEDPKIMDSVDLALRQLHRDGRRLSSLKDNYRPKNGTHKKRDSEDLQGRQRYVIGRVGSQHGLVEDNECGCGGTSCGTKNEVEARKNKFIVVPLTTNSDYQMSDSDASLPRDRRPRRVRSEKGTEYLMVPNIPSDEDADTESMETFHRGYNRPIVIAPVTTHRNRKRSPLPSEYVMLTEDSIRRTRSPHNHRRNEVPTRDSKHPATFDASSSIHRSPEPLLVMQATNEEKIRKTSKEHLAHELKDKTLPFKVNENIQAYPYYGSYRSRYGELDDDFDSDYGNGYYGLYPRDSYEMMNGGLGSYVYNRYKPYRSRHIRQGIITPCRQNCATQCTTNNCRQLGHVRPRSRGLDSSLYDCYDEIDYVGNVVRVCRPGTGMLLDTVSGIGGLGGIGGITGLNFDSGYDGRYRRGLRGNRGILSSMMGTNYYHDRYDRSPYYSRRYGSGRRGRYRYGRYDGPDGMYSRDYYRDYYGGRRGRRWRSPYERFASGADKPNDGPQINPRRIIDPLDFDDISLEFDQNSFNWDLYQVTCANVARVLSENPISSVTLSLPSTSAINPIPNSPESVNFMLFETNKVQNLRSGSRERIQKCVAEKDDLISSKVSKETNETDVANLQPEKPVKFVKYETCETVEQSTSLSSCLEKDQSGETSDRPRIKKIVKDENNKL